MHLSYKTGYMTEVSPLETELTLTRWMVPACITLRIILPFLPISVNESNPEGERHGCILYFLLLLVDFVLGSFSEACE
jgi:hypothetical protein